MNSRTLLAGAALAALVTAARPAGAQAPLAVDLSHTTATFSLKHLTLTTVTGSIGVKSLDLAVGPDRLPTRVVADLDLATIDTHESRRDDDLRGEHWFDVKSYPDMIFTSTKISGDAKAFTIAGDLAFHGVTKPVTLAAKYDGSVTDARGRTHDGYSATATIDRTQWNVGSRYPAVVVGHDVAVTLEVETVRGG